MRNQSFFRDRKLAKQRLFPLLMFFALFLAACGGGEAPAPLSPEVDTEAIVADVLAELEQLDVPETTAVESESNPTPPPPPQPTVAPVINSALPPATDAFGLENTLIALYKQANPAVVFIIVPPLGTGSGFVYSIDDTRGYIVTNNHVIDNGSSYEVVFADGSRERAELVGADVDSDLAVLQVDNIPADITPLSLADPSSIEVGQFVIAIGNPFGEQGSMSLGIVSALGRSLSSQRTATSAGGSYSLPEVIQTDAPINPGNSGGPLLNLQGEVVGVNSAIATLTGTNTGVGFAIPVAAVRQIVPSLISNGEYKYAYIGASFDNEVSLDEQQLYGLPQTSGAYVFTVVPNSPANDAGLLGADPGTGRGGDLIVAIDGQPIQTFDDLNAYLVFNTQAGQTVEMTVIRDGEEITLSLTLGERP